MQSGFATIAWVQWHRKASCDRRGTRSLRMPRRTGADADPFRIANLQRKTDNHSRPIAALHVVDAHGSASNAMPHGPGCSCDSRRTPSNHPTHVQQVAAGILVYRRGEVMSLDRGTLAKIDRRVLSELDHGEGVQLVKVPVSEASK